MSRSDRERWDRKYAAHPDPAYTPDPLLIQHEHLLKGGGWALDVACGVGQNAAFLARHDYDVLAVDGSLTGLRYGQRALAGANLPVHLVNADLDRFPLPRDRFAVTVVFRFLNRALIPELKQSAIPGGLMVYETFNVNQLRFAPQMKRAYLLEPGELAQMFADWETLASNDGPQIQSELSYWIGRRPV